MVKVNGTELDLAGKTVSAYLATTNYDPRRIAVERNGDIVPKAAYAQTILMDDDQIEIAIAAVKYTLKDEYPDFETEEVPGEDYRLVK